MTEAKAVLMPILTSEQLGLLEYDFQEKWLAERGWKKAADADRLNELQRREMYTARYEYMQQFQSEYPQSDWRDTKYYCRDCGKQTIVIDMYQDNYDYEEGRPEYCVNCVNLYLLY